jgi:hypothetical protein
MYLIKLYTSRVPVLSFVLLVFLATDGLTFALSRSETRNSEKRERSVLREKLLLDLGWKFHLGDASDQIGRASCRERVFDKV